jgi:FkbM family methyltransferase
MTNVTIVEAAVTQGKGRHAMSDLGPESNVFNVLDGNGSLQVLLKSLDELIQDHGVDRIDLLTVNIEGAERDALRGMDRGWHLIRHAAITCHDFRSDRTGDGSF